jgi:hypothetical protein
MRKCTRQSTLPHLFMTATGTEMRLPKKEAHQITNTIKNIRVMKI